MTSDRRTVRILVHRDGDLQSKSITMPYWLYRTATIAAVCLAILIIIAAVLYAPIARAASQVPGLTRDVERLSAENQQVHELAATIEAIEASYNQLVSMHGADIVPELDDPETMLPVAYAVFARHPDAATCYETGPSRPTHWPLGGAGVITRGPVGVGSSTEVHNGIDIAVARGTVVRAAGGGRIAQAGFNAEYGFFVRIDHAERFESMYGHMSRLLVTESDSVNAGQALGLSGSTGRSTAPHLHFEIFESGQSIDPSPMVTQECSNGTFLVQGG